MSDLKKNIFLKFNFSIKSKLEFNKSVKKINSFSTLINISSTKEKINFESKLILIKKLYEIQKSQ